MSSSGWRATGDEGKRRSLPLLALLAIAGLAVAGEAEPERRLKEVIVVFKTHFDIGYTALAREVVESYRTRMIDKALALCEQSEGLRAAQRFVWAVPGWPMAQILWPGQAPERRERLLQALRQGRLVVHALPFTIETESLDLEDVVRGLRFSADIARAVGQPLPRDAKLTDVPSHAWALPTILKRAGIEFLHIGCNAAPVCPEVPPLFWWEGPDGSRLLTMYSREYGTGLAPPRGWPHATWLALIHTGDNQGPPDAADVQRLVERAERELPGVAVRMGRLSDFADALLREKPELPVVRGDMPDTWIHGMMAAPQGARLARHTRVATAALEALDSLLRAWDVKAPSVQAAVASAYEGTLLYGEHTWGLDAKGFAPYLYGKAWQEAHAQGRYKRLEESWAEHAAYAGKADELVRPALDGHLDALARAVKAEGRRIVVFNPLPWARDGIVAVAVPGPRIAAVKDLATGATAPVDADEAVVRFLARDVPPLGYRTYAPAEAWTSARSLAADERAATLENRFLKVTLDPARGGIASLLDKRSGRELADAAAPPALGQYLYERFDADNVNAYLQSYLRMRANWAVADLGKPGLPPAKEAPYAAASPEDFAVEFHKGAAAVSATLRAAASQAVPHAVALTVTLYEGQPFVDLEWSVSDKRPDPWPEAGWLCLPFRVESPRFRLARLGAVVDPARDVIRCTNHDAYWLNGGMTIVGPDGRGVGLCSPDAPLVSLERPGIWRFSRDFSATKPTVYVNLFNNAISTNFPLWVGGTWSARVRLWAVGDDKAEPGLITPSWEARSPLRAAACDADAGTLPPAQAGLTLSRKGILVTAFGPNPDGEGTLLRLWEMAGDAAPCRVRLPEGLRARKAQPCGLRGQKLGQPIPIANTELETPITPFAPATLLLGP